jgi:5'-nucleotidase / UDP-sugar diphosphatase
MESPRDAGNRGARERASRRCGVLALASALSAWVAAAPLGAARPGAVEPAATTTAVAQAPDTSRELRLTILHTSDEHSALLPWPRAHDGGGAARGGFPRLARVVEDVRARKARHSEPVLLTSAGDHTGGTPFSWLVLDGEAPELTLMVELGYDAITLGNHEFDYGPDRLAASLSAAGFPAAAARTAILATNTHPPPAHPLAEAGLRRTHLLELSNGLRVGFLGLIGEDAVRVTTAAAPVTFIGARDAAAAAVTELRAAGAHIIVAITHAGLAEDRALARAVPGIDVILGGHDHRLLAGPARERNTLIVHPGADAAQLAQLELAYDPVSGAVRTRNEETGAPAVLRLDASVEESAWMAARVAAYRSRLDDHVAALTGGRFTDVDAAIARSSFPLRAGPPRSESSFGDFVTDAMGWAAERALGVRADFVAQSNGAIRGDLLPGVGPRAGEIAFYDLAGRVGLGSGPDGVAGYPLVSLWLTGAEVRRALEVSVLLSRLLGDSYFLQLAGLRVRYDPRRAVLARVPFRGTPIPSGRAVLAAERRDVDGGHVPLERGDTALYHVITDRHVASFLPMVGRIVPRFAIEPRDAAGRPLASLDDALVMRDGAELKVWQAVVEYAAAQPPGEDGMPVIPHVYREPQGRLIEVRGTPLWLWPLVALLAVLAAAGVVVARRRGAATP